MQLGISAGRSEITQNRGTGGGTGREVAGRETMSSILDLLPVGVGAYGGEVDDRP